MSDFGDQPYRWIKGRIEAYVKNQNGEDSNAVVKAIVTMSTNNAIGDEALKKILDEVHSNTG
jgi:hypothetical protein